MCFFLYEPAYTEIYTYLHTLSLHDALPICPAAPGLVQYPCQPDSGFILIASVTDSPGLGVRDSKASDASIWRSWADAGARAMTPTPKASVTTSVSRRRKTIMDYASLPAACSALNRLASATARVRPA